MARLTVGDLAPDDYDERPSDEEDMDAYWARIERVTSESAAIAHARGDAGLGYALSRIAWMAGRGGRGHEDDDDRLEPGCIPPLRQAAELELPEPDGPVHVRMPGADGFERIGRAA